MLSDRQYTVNTCYQKEGTITFSHIDDVHLLSSYFSL
jgi:hypothetical protein